MTTSQTKLEEEKVAEKVTYTPSPKRNLKQKNEIVDYNSVSTTPTSKASTNSLSSIVKSRASDNTLKVNQLSLKEKLPNFTNNFDEILANLQRTTKMDQKSHTDYIKKADVNSFKRAFNARFHEECLKKESLNLKKKISNFCGERPTKLGGMEVFPEKSEMLKKLKSDETIMFNKHDLMTLEADKEKVSHLISNSLRKTSSYNNDEIQKEIKYLSNIEEINDYYEYTEECLLKILKLSQPSEKEIEDLQKTANFPSELYKNKKIVVFDVDETLIHCDSKSPKKSDVILSVNLPIGGTAKIGVNLRPHLIDCLKKVKELFMIVAYTASHQAYADTILDYIDPKKEIFSYRFYRQHCLKVRAEDEHIYVKDLRIFKDFNLANILENGIPILPFYDNKEDNELSILVNYLNHLAEVEDIRVENRKYIKLHMLLKRNSGENTVSSEEEESLRNKILAEEANYFSSNNEGKKHTISTISEHFDSNNSNFSEIDLSKNSNVSEARIESKRMFEECQKTYRSLFQK